MLAIDPQSTAPIRLGFVMHKMQVAGAEVLVQQIIERLDAEIEATVFCLDGLGEIGQQLRDSGVPVIVLDRRPGFDRALAGRLASEIVARNIEVLHAHQYTPFFYAALARIQKRLACKVLFTEHGRHYPDVVSKKRRWANRLVFQRYADVTTACCDFSTEALHRIEGFPKAITLRNGVDLGGLPNRGNEAERRKLKESLGLDSDRRYVACIARFHPVKDHAMLIRAWSQVHKQLPEANLLLVGDGPERGNLERQIGELSVSDHSASGSRFDSSIQFLGIRDDVPEILRAVDAFVLTSVSEAASLTLLEAMASGCPSVVTDVGGNAEHLREGVDGYLVPRGDDVALATRLVEVLSDSSKASALGQAARTRVATHFSLNDIVQQYASHYRALASGVGIKSTPSFVSPNERLRARSS